MTAADCYALDDATTRYVMAAQPPFEMMRASAAQLAGYLLQRVIDPGSRMGQAPGLALLSDRIAEAESLLLAIVPRGPVAAHHYRHLSDAMQSLCRALAAALQYRSTARIPALADACERPLNEAIGHLRHAANALPGFELVDLADCCGAAHIRNLSD